MIKRILATLAAAGLATVGLAAMPASADTTAAGNVNLFELENYEGATVSPADTQVPTTCTSIAATLPLDYVRSAQNETTDTEVAFYTASTCATASEIARLEPGQVDPSIVDPNDATLGATYWMAVS